MKKMNAHKITKGYSPITFTNLSITADFMYTGLHEYYNGTQKSEYLCQDTVTN